MFKNVIVVLWLVFGCSEILFANEKISFIGPEEEYVDYEKLQIETMSGDSFLFEIDAKSGNLKRIFTIIDDVKWEVPKLILDEIFYPDFQTVEILSNTVNKQKYYILRMVFMEYHKNDKLFVNSSEVIEYQLRIVWLYDKKMKFDVEITNKDNNLLLMKWPNNTKGQALK